VSDTGPWRKVTPGQRPRYSDSATCGTRW
jgi:hypothetical protein